MTTSFNLTSQPWIPCESMDGTLVEMSTLDVLLNAHRLRAIVDPSPLVVAVLHRHLLAVLHRAYDGPKSMRQWSDIARAGRFEATPIEAYLSRVSDRMDLFHPAHPFAQTRGLEREFPKGVDPIDQLTLERSSWGSARELFQHRRSGHRPALSPAEAARWLLAHHAFATGGLVKKPNEPTSASAAPLLKAGVVLLKRETLVSTLTSNLLIYAPEDGQPIPGAGEDAPAWEQEPPPRQVRTKREPERLPRGWLDVLTWLSRRLELVHDGSRVTGYVRAVYQGMSAEGPRDPMVTYRLDDKRGFVPVGLDLERAFWRNANALFQASNSSERRFERPKAIDLVTRPKVVSLVGESAQYIIQVHGVSASKSRVDMVRAESMAANAKCLDDPDAREAVEHVLDIAQKLVTVLQSALWRFGRYLLSAGDREPDKNDRRSLVNSLGAESAAWSALGLAFDSFLHELGEDIDTAQENFEGRARAVVEQRFHAATAISTSSGDALKARAKAEQFFSNKMKELKADETLNAKDLDQPVEVA